MINIGDNLPDLKLQAYHDNQIKDIDLKDYKDKWLVIFFYPADFTFVCPTELGEMADKYEEFKKAGAEVMSVSTDSVFVHKAWHEASETIKKIKFPMLADPTGKLSRLFGTYIEDEGVALRGSFIFDPDGVLKAMEIHHNDLGRSADELLRKLQAGIHVREHGGEACPANWRPGSQTLKPGLDLVGKI